MEATLLLSKPQCLIPHGPCILTEKDKTDLLSQTFINTQILTPTDSPKLSSFIRQLQATLGITPLKMVVMFLYCILL